MNEMHPESGTKSVCFIHLFSSFTLVRTVSAAESAAGSDGDEVELSAVLNEGGFKVRCTALPGQRIKQKGSTLQLRRHTHDAI